MISAKQHFPLEFLRLQVKGGDPVPVSVTIDTFSAQGAWKRGSNCPCAIKRQSISLTSWFPPAIPGPEPPFPGRTCAIMKDEG